MSYKEPQPIRIIGRFCHFVPGILVFLLGALPFISASLTLSLGKEVSWREERTLAFATVMLFMSIIFFIGGYIYGLPEKKDQTDSCLLTEVKKDKPPHNKDSE